MISCFSSGRWLISLFPPPKIAWESVSFVRNSESSLRCVSLGRNEETIIWKVLRSLSKEIHARLQLKKNKSDHLDPPRKGKGSLRIVDCHTFHIGFTLKTCRYCLNVLFKSGCFAGRVQLVVKTVRWSTPVNVWPKQTGVYSRVGLDVFFLKVYFLQTWKYERKQG